MCCDCKIKKNKSDSTRYETMLDLESKQFSKQFINV